MKLHHLLESTVKVRSGFVACVTKKPITEDFMFIVGLRTKTDAEAFYADVETELEKRFNDGGDEWYESYVLNVLPCKHDTLLDATVVMLYKAVKHSSLEDLQCLAIEKDKSDFDDYESQYDEKLPENVVFIKLNTLEEAMKVLKRS